MLSPRVSGPGTAVSEDATVRCRVRALSLGNLPTLSRGCAMTVINGNLSRGLPDVCSCIVSSEPREMEAMTSVISCGFNRVS